MATTQDVAMVDIAFQPTELTIAANTDVTINLINQGALPHSFVIDELGVNSSVIDPGQIRHGNDQRRAGHVRVLLRCAGA